MIKYKADTNITIIPRTNQFINVIDWKSMAIIDSFMFPLYERKATKVTKPISTTAALEKTIARYLENGKQIFNKITRLRELNAMTDICAATLIS